MPSTGISEYLRGSVGFLQILFKKDYKVLHFGAYSKKCKKKKKQQQQQQSEKN